MADTSTGLAVKSLDTETVRTQIVDSAGTNEAAVSAAGRLSVDASGVAIQIAAGTNNIGDVDVLSVIPGTTATSLGKAEDTGHTTGDTGVMVLAVRNDAGTVLSDTTLDYTPLSTDNTGALRVTGGSAGTQYVGDAAATATPTGTLAMGLANASAPADVSANNDAVAQWFLRNGSSVTNLASGGTLITIGQKTAANGLPVTLASDQATLAAPLGIRISDGAAALIGQKAMAASLPVVIASDQGSLTTTNAANLVDNAGFTDSTSTVTAVGFIFDDVAGTALTENDIAAARLNANRSQVIVGEDNTTRGQRWSISAAGALASNITQVGGATMSATVALSSRLTDGTAYYTKTGQTAATAAFAQLSDQTTAVNVIVATNALKTDLSSVGGTATVTGGVAGTQGVGGVLAHDAAAAAALPVGIGGFASAAAPTDVSADGDAVKIWSLRNGSQVVNLASGGTLVTLGSKVSASSLPVVLSSDGYGATAANTMHVTLSTGAADYTLFGQAIGSAPWTRLTDGTTTAGVIAGTTSLKTDFSSIVGAVPSATNPVPVRLTDGASFYASASGAPTLPKFSTKTSAALGAGASVDLTHYVTSGKTGQLTGVDVASTIAMKVVINTELTAAKTARVVLFTPAGVPISWRAPYKTYITQTSADATSGFSVTITNKDTSVAADVYSTGFWDEV